MSNGKFQPIAPRRRFDSAASVPWARDGSRIALSENVVLEWRSADPVCAVRGGGSVGMPLTLEIGVTDTWVRLSVSFGESLSAGLLGSRMVVRARSRQPGVPLETKPILAWHHVSSGRFVERLPKTLVPLSLPEGQWVAICGVHLVAASRDGRDLDMAVNLPTDCEIDLLCIDATRAAATLGENRLAELEQAGAETVRPFAVTPLSEAERSCSADPAEPAVFGSDLIVSEGRLSGWILMAPDTRLHAVLRGRLRVPIEIGDPVELLPAASVTVGAAADLAGLGDGFFDASDLTVETEGARLLAGLSAAPVVKGTLALEAKLEPGLKVRGAAFVEEEPDCILRVRIRDKAGEILAEARADRRDGPAKAPQGHGFLLTLPINLIDGTWHVLTLEVVGFPDERRTLELDGTRSVTGKVTAIFGDRIEGWAMLQSAPEAKLGIAAFIGDELLVSAETGHFHPYLTKQFSGLSGFQGFSLPLSEPLSAEDLRQLEVRLAGWPDTIYILNRVRNKAVLSTEKRAEKADRTEHTAEVLSRLDKVNQSGISGWAINLAEPDKPVTVELSVDGLPLERVIADAHRRDLGREYNSHGRHGFHIGFPPGFEVRDKATVRAHALTPRPVELIGSPRAFETDTTGVVPHRSSSASYPEDIYRPAPETGSAVAGQSVALVILNRDGAQYLETFFQSFDRFNTWTAYRILVIDHGSTDESSSVCERWAERLNVEVIRRGANYSFSESNNLGADFAQEDILFFVNNDVEFCQCALSGVTRYFQDPEIGILGAKLIAPIGQARGQPSRPGFVQHLGVKFGLRADRPSVSPYEVPIGPTTGGVSYAPWLVPAVTGAALAIRRADFIRLGGFDERYFYGYEDVDFCLSMSAILGKSVVSANDIALYHVRGATRSVESAEKRQRFTRNLNLLSERHGSRVRQAIRQEAWAGRRFHRQAPLRVAFAVSRADFAAPEADYFTAWELGDELVRQFGWEVSYLEPNAWYDLSKVDVLVAMRQDYSPRKISARNSDLVLVAWPRNWFDHWLRLPWISEFNLIWAASEKAGAAFRLRFSIPVEIVRIATNPTRFQLSAAEAARSAFSADYVFTGSFFKAPRDIVACLDPAALPYDFAIVGHNWQDVGWLEPYWRGPVSYDRMPEIYENVRIVLDDANRTARPWGSVNSRVFDALAAGALVLSNGEIGSREVFEGLLPTYRNREELTALLSRYLSDEPARRALVAELRTRVLAEHTYAHRAQTVRDSLKPAFCGLRFAVRGLHAEEAGTSSGPAEAAAALVSDVAVGLREAGYFVQSSEAATAPESAAQFGEDVVLHLSVGLVSTRMEHRSDQTNVRLHFGGTDDLSLGEVRHYDALVVCSETVASVFSAAGRPILTVFDDEESKSACYEFDAETGEMILKDPRALAAAISRLCGTLVARSRAWDEARSDPAPIRCVGSARRPKTAVPATELLFWPDYTATNPYQTCVYADMPTSLDIRPGTLERALALVENDPAKPVIFHLHWTAPVMGLETARLVAEQRQRAFLDNLDRFVGAGGILIWTVHNQISHEAPFPDLEARLCAAIAEAASLIHVHGERVPEIVRANYALPEEKVLVAPHGSYLGVYPDTVTRSEARRRLGLPPEARVLVFLGQIRSYKGIDGLLSAHATLRASHPDLWLVLAGQPVNLEDDGLLERAAAQEGVVLNAVTIPDDRLQLYLRAGDVMVLPYTRVLSSGSVYLALSFGLPVVAPLVGLIPDVVRDGAEGFLYDPEDPEGLRHALQRVAEATPETLAERSASAVRQARRSDWSQLHRLVARDAHALALGIRRNVPVGKQMRRCVVAGLAEPVGRRVAAIILHYRHTDDTIRCVLSLLNQRSRDLHVYIVSNDETAEAFATLASMFPDCTVVQSPDNLGYAGGNNIALALAQARGFEFCWLVNPDTVAPREYLGRMLEIADRNQEVGVFGSTITFGDRPKTVWFAGGQISWDDGLRAEHLYIGRNVDTLPATSIPSDYITGASLFFRARLLEDVGFIPEQYFLYFEETHWCLTASRMGEQIMTFPQVSLEHHKRSEEDGAPTLTYLYYYIRNALLMCEAFNPEQIAATERRIRTLSEIWLHKISTVTPNQRSVAERAIALGLEHGKAGISGKVDLDRLLA